MFISDSGGLNISLGLDFNPKLPEFTRNFFTVLWETAWWDSAVSPQSAGMMKLGTHFARESFRCVENRVYILHMVTNSTRLFIHLALIIFVKRIICLSFCHNQSFCWKDIKMWKTRSPKVMFGISSGLFH